MVLVLANGPCLGEQRCRGMCFQGTGHEGGGWSLVTADQPLGENVTALQLYHRHVTVIEGARATILILQEFMMWINRKTGSHGELPESLNPVDMG